MRNYWSSVVTLVLLCHPKKTRAPIRPPLGTFLVVFRPRSVFVLFVWGSSWTSHNSWSFCLQPEAGSKKPHDRRHCTSRKLTLLHNNETFTETKVGWLVSTTTAALRCLIWPWRNMSDYLLCLGLWSCKRVTLTWLHQPKLLQLLLLRAEHPSRPPETGRHVSTGHKRICCQ